LKPIREAYYQISTNSGYVCVEMPFSLSPDDAEDVISNFELIIRQIRRRSEVAKLSPCFDPILLGC